MADIRWKKRGYTTEEVLAFRNAFDALKEVLTEEFTKKEAVRDYGTPGWEHRQIAANEYNAVLTDILKLISITKE